ncbi:MAG: hypothetical protein PUA81_08480 [Oscillospiraceae bacterium]|nr:hypothetical protein [Oscillospiraceae bacterium]
MSKRILTALLSLCICAGFASCGKEDSPRGRGDDDDTSISDSNDDDDDDDDDDTDKNDKNDDDGDSEKTTRLSRSERKKLEEEAKTEPPTEAPTESPMRNPISPQVKNPIIYGINLGMTKNDVFSVVGQSYDNSTVGSVGDNYIYDIEYSGELGIKMKGSVSFEFDGDSLCNYAYHFGINAQDEVYTEYTEDDLKAAFDSARSALEQFTGTPGEQGAAVDNAFGSLAWHDTPYGDIILIGGSDLWGVSDNTQVLIVVDGEPVINAVSGGGAAAFSDSSIIGGVDKNTTEDEILSIFGSDYIYEEYNEPGYKETRQYTYNFDNLTVCGINTYMHGSMFFEFNIDGSMRGYGYHLGSVYTNDENFIYPYSEDELKSTYDEIYNSLQNTFGDGTYKTGLSDANVFSEYEWDTDNGQLWFVYGVDMWAIEPAKTYEKGINEIILSCYENEN